MLLYCISIFLRNENIDKFLQICKNNRINYKRIEVTDQTNEKGNGYQVNINGIKILALPCNSFHRDKDFEIGITVENINEWNEFVRKMKNKFENEYGKFDDGETEYFIIKNEKLHGNFFFIYDGQKSQNEHLIMLECRMAKDDFDFYKAELETIIGTDITNKIKVISDERFEMNKLIIEALENDIVIEL